MSVKLLSQNDLTVVGIDVGGERKGFHAVALRDHCFVKMAQFSDAAEVADWCQEQNAFTVAVDAPCAWSQCGASRLAERKLSIDEKIIQCFKTPTRLHASKQKSGFYDWIFNGEALYQHLINKRYSLFDGTSRDTRTVLETFPHAVVCALAGKKVSVQPKSMVRRKVLRDMGYDENILPNIDFVDAGICALTAQAFLSGNWQCFGNKEEGCIVLPSRNIQSTM